MQGMSRQEQLTFELRGPSGLDEPEVKLFVRSVNFVADNGMTNRREMHSNLVRASCVRNRANQAEFAGLARALKWPALATASRLWSHPASVGRSAFMSA